MAEIYEVRRHHSIQTHVDYNQFFHPNICHICKSADMDNLILCDRCNMISYCTEEHKRLHRLQHADICILLTRFISEDPDWDTHRSYFQDWIQKQESLVRISQMALGRKLKTYEVQMFMFARVCFICRRRTNLSTCEKCLSANYCADHMSETSLHETLCDDLALSVNLDIVFLEETAWEAIRVKFTNFPDKKKSFNDINSFYGQYYKKQSKRGDSAFNVYTFTDYVSGPLTLYYGLQSANLFFLKNITHSFIIHIIAADYVDRRNFPAWELFLHLLNRKNNLIVVMVGPELQLETYEHKVCSRCRAAKKKLILQSFPLLYHNYVHNTSYIRPNMIVGFQAELSYDQSWPESIRAIQAQNCPLLLTATSQLKAHWDMIEIGKVLGTSVKPILHTENYFASCRPYRDFENGYVFFRNNYLIIYKDLNNSNKLIEANSNYVYN